jgi:hypothetical protein
VRLAKLALGVLAISYVVAHFVAGFREAANWDEFVMYRRAMDAATTGILDTGGRPGLGVLLLVPFVDGCDHVMSVVHGTRVLWGVFTLAALAGLFELLRRSVSWHAASLGVAAVALVPIFMRWSLHARTDQPAVAFALWGGVALLASRKRPWLSVMAGALIGTGYLFSQKAIYITALVAVVAAAPHFIERDVRWRREGARVASMIVGAIVPIVVYRLVVAALYTVPVISLESSLDQLSWYRTVLHWRLYPAMVSTVVAQIGLLALIIAAFVHSIVRDTAERRRLLVAVVVMVLGISVARFHTASFPYFWITLGMFPAVAIGLGLPGLQELMPRLWRPVVGVACLVLLAGGIWFGGETLEDTQQAQEDVLDAVEGLPREMRGFQVEGALVCRPDPAPIPAYLSSTIVAAFSGTNGERNARAFIQEHRDRPVSFVIMSHRLGTFPDWIKRFWAQHYVQYRSTLALAGRKIAGPAGSTHELDVIVPGTYRWMPSTPARLVGGGITLMAGETIQLTAGVKRFELLDGVEGGMLVIAVEAAPDPRERPFYPLSTILELSGLRERWWRR